MKSMRFIGLTIATVIYYVLRKLIIGLVLYAITWLFFGDLGAQTVEVYNIFGKRDDADWKNAARQVFITGGIENQRWLTIIRFDTTAPEQRGFDPCFTYAVCKYKPIVKKLPNGLWQISFTSEIAEGIP